MLLANAVMDTVNIAFDIGDQGVDPKEHLWRLLPRIGNEPLMVVGQDI